jgi:hypothetical protein
MVPVPTQLLPKLLNSGILLHVFRYDNDLRHEVVEAFQLTDKEWKQWFGRVRVHGQLTYKKPR